jgi:hypothetical protein
VKLSTFGVSFFSGDFNDIFHETVSPRLAAEDCITISRRLSRGEEISFKRFFLHAVERFIEPRPPVYGSRPGWTRQFIKPRRLITFLGREAFRDFNCLLLIIDKS